MKTKRQLVNFITCQDDSGFHNMSKSWEWVRRSQGLMGWRTTEKTWIELTISASGQDEPNLALWLGTRAGKMELSCPLGVRVMSRKERLSTLSFYGVLSRIINPLLTKLVRSKWLDIDLVLFFACLWTSTSSRNLANIQPSWPHAWSITHI